MSQPSVNAGRALYLARHGKGPAVPAVELESTKGAGAEVFTDPAEAPPVGTPPPASDPGSMGSLTGSVAAGTALYQAQKGKRSQF